MGKDKADKPKKTESADKVKPRTGTLNVDEFRSVLQKLKSLGLTWTADIPALGCGETEC